MAVRGIRGAITVSEDMAGQVLEATCELLTAIYKENDLNIENIASAFFTVTSDIRSVFPAKAARSLGWNLVPLLCFQEIEVPNALPRCIRVMILINTEKKQNEMRHVYLKGAEVLRQDLMTDSPASRDGS